MAERKEIRVPDLGDFSDVDVIEVLVSPGDTVEVEDGLIVLETDKASMDVPSTAAGKVVEIAVSTGDTVNEGDLIAVVEAAEESGADSGAGSGDEGKDTDDADRSADEGGDDDEPADEASSGADESDKAESEAESDGDSKSDGGKDDGATVAEPGRRRVQVPDLGDFDEVDVIEVHVAEGDEVAEEDPLLTLETDKASMDVPSPAAGRVAELLVSVGDKVNSGDDVLTLLTAGGEDSGEDSGEESGKEDAAKQGGEQPAEADRAGGAGEEEKKSAAPARREPKGDETGRRERVADAEERREVPSGFPGIDEPGFSRAHASPSVRRLARELGVDLVRVEGTGRKGRILAGDVKDWVKKALKGGGEAAAGTGAGLPAVPEVDFSKYGDTVTQPLGRVRKISARRLQAAWLNLPHVTQHDLADITELEERRQELKGAAAERGIKLTPLAFIIQACVQALKEFPRFNSSLHPDGEHLVMKHYFHIGFAADTPNGLVVPVIRDADRKDVYELAAELAELSAAAREGKLSAEQMRGGTFTVSSLGGIGGTAFTPIINAPEVAILGVSRSSMQPVWNGREFKPRLMLPLSLSYDHRVIDGADAARFTTWLSGALGDVGGLLEAVP